MTNLESLTVSILLVLAVCRALPRCGDGGGGEGDVDTGPTGRAAGWTCG